MIDYILSLEELSEATPTSIDIKKIEKIVLKYFPDAKKTKAGWEATTEPNPKDEWAKPIAYDKFEKEVKTKFYSFMAGGSWDSEGHVEIKHR